MPAEKTYEPIITTTLGSLQTSVTIGSGGTGTIPSTYTDLVLVARTFANANSYVGVRFNGDTTSNYSTTRVYGVGGGTGGTTSDRYANATGIFGGSTAAGESIFISNIAAYTSSKWKTVVARENSNFRVGGTVGVWRSTSTINSITLYAPDSTGFAAGSTFTLFGIAAA
jgi:hypothetical protein